MAVPYLIAALLGAPALAADPPRPAGTSAPAKAKKPTKRPPAVPVKPAPKPTPRPTPEGSSKPSPRPTPAGSAPHKPGESTPVARPGQRPTSPGTTRPTPGTSRPTQPASPSVSQEPGPRPRGALSGRPTSLPASSRATSPAAVSTTAREVVPSRAVPSTTLGPSRTTVPPGRSTDHRFARPDPYAVRPYPSRPVPAYYWYRPYYTHWWVHPYWRWTHATVVVVGFGYAPAPWDVVWVPPVRAGWVWIPGHRTISGWWVPGHWAPAGSPPVAYGAQWVYVPGWWMGAVYVEGFWRRSARPGFVWVDGYYLDDGSYVRGWWAPEGGAPRAGYVWEGGYWDGEDWVEGFWRPSARPGYRWVSSWLDEEGVFHSGYWEPVEDNPGHVWIPGWFDGETWVEGYWVEEQTYRSVDPEKWEPEEGWDDRGDRPTQPSEDEAPLALPVEVR